MKKIKSLAVFLILLCFFSAGNAWAADSLPIYINGQRQEFTVEPYAVDGSIVVPVRQIAEAFDVPVVWDEAAQQATIQRGEETLVLRLGSQTALYNGVEVPLPIKPQTKADVTFLPLRYVAEWLQLQVEFKDGAAYLQPAELGDTPDTLTLPKGNSNANLAAGGDMLLWQDKIYFRYRMYIEGLACTANIVQWTPETEDFDPARPTPKYEILLPGDNYSHFNVWQGQVYAICNNNFVKLGADFKPAATIVENVCYAQIQDGWLYYITRAEEPENEKLYRLPLAGGPAQDLGLANIQSPEDWLERQILLTDNHIYAYVQNAGRKVLFAMSLDGTERREIIALDNVGALDYADGYLYFNLDYDYGYANDEANIVRSSLHRIKTDGSGLERLSEAGAEDINIIGDWLYFSQIERTYTSDDGGLTFAGWRLCRLRLDGSDLQVLTDGKQSGLCCYGMPMLCDGRVFFTELYSGNGQQWWELALND